MFGEDSLRVKMMRKIGATRVLALSFILVIVLGSVFLSLPMTNRLQPLGYLDNLFIATSATCVTGLVPINIMEQFNHLGYTVILILIQIGGIGVMSLIAFIITITKHRLYHSEKIMLQDALNKDTLQDMPQFLKSIIKYTILFEVLGALLIMIRFIPTYGIFEGMYNAIFLSVSAFCNAGIDNFSMISLGEYTNDTLINAVVATLIILGGLGFTVWFDLRKKIIGRIQGKYSIRKMFTLLNLHTKVVLMTTFGLIFSGMVLILFTEMGNTATLASMNFFDQMQVALFQSITLRTAGFSTIDFALLQESTLFFMILYMLIGGSPGGTAGGIKTTALVMIFLFVKLQFSGKDKITIFNRTLSSNIFNKAFMVVILYFSFIMVSTLLLSISEDIAFLPLLFEIASAIGTVGLSAGVTPLLSEFGQVVIIVLMFVGRLGPITIALSMMKKRVKNKGHEVEYPHADLLIG